MYKWTCAVQAHVIQGLTVLSKIVVKLYLLFCIFVKDL